MKRFTIISGLVVAAHVIMAFSYKVGYEDAILDDRRGRPKPRWYR